MAHQFATGQTKPQRTRLQQGAVTLLSGLKRSAGGYLVEVLPYAFTMDGTTTSDDVAQFVNALSRAPSIAVHVADREDRPAAIGGFASWGEVDLLVYHSSNNARNQQIGRMEIDTAGLADDHADPGLHIMMEHARELIIGQRAGAPGDDIKQVRPFREQEVITAQPITIWLQTYKVTVLTQLDEFRTVTQLLGSLRFRTSQDLTEVHLPAAKTKSTTLDINEDDLAP